MVLKSIIRYIINRYLKNYIEQLDDEKLNFDFRHGHVRLENLRLKPEALADFNLPVTVACGYLEKLALTIPWMHLSTHPTKIFINGLYILIVPKNELGRDLTEYHANKMRRVQRKVDDLRKTILENKKLDEKETTFFERMRLQIMHNIEVNIENLHICYETNSTTKLGHPFSFGITFHSLKITTINDPNTRKQTIEKIPIIYTLKEINTLSIYWNTKCQSRVNMPFNIIVDDLKSKIATNDYKPKDNYMNYIVYPVSLNANVTVTITPGEHNFDRSTFDMNVLVNEMTLNIDSKQFSDLLDFGKFQNYSTLYERCREYRELHLQESIDSNQLNQLQKDRLKILETKLDVYNLAYIRHSVEIEIENKTMMDKASQHISHNKYNRWNWLWRKKHKHLNDERRISMTTTEIYHDDGFSFYFEDLSNILINIATDKLYLNLVSPLSDNISSYQSSEKLNRQIIAHINVIDAKINVIKQSVSSSLLFQLTLPYFQLYGIHDNISNAPLLVNPLSTCSSPVMHIEFELFPINRSKSDYRFHLNIQPISIIYDAAMFNRIVECFDVINHIKSFSLSEIKQRTNLQMEQDLIHEKIFDMTIELKGFSIIFPENGVYKKHCSSLNVHFHQFILKSCLDENEIESQEKLIPEQRFYVKYKLNLNDLRMIYTHSDGKYFNLLGRIPIINITFLKCIYSDDANLDDWYIDMKINQINKIEISNKILQKIIMNFQTIPNFYDTISEILYRINLYFEIFRNNISFKGNILINQFLFIIRNDPSILIQINLYSSILRTREKFNKIIIILQNIIMKRNRLSYPFYLNKHLELNYINNNT